MVDALSTDAGTEREGRDPQTGRFRPGNTAALKHGVASERVRRREALVAGQRLFAEGAAAALAELEEELGAGRPLSTVQRATARRFLEVEAVATFLAQRMMAEGGPLTAKGRTRSYLDHFLKVVDRQVKLAQLLGLRPVEKQILPHGGLPSLDAYQPPDHDDEDASA